MEGSGVMVGTIASSQKQRNQAGAKVVTQAQSHVRGKSVTIADEMGAG